MHPPSAFGTFRVLHQIGSGVLGPVFRSYDSERERLVVIKAFRLDLTPSQLPVVADALREIVTRPIDADSVVRAVDAGLEGNLPYLALEFVSGDTLDAVLRDAPPMSWPAVTRCCRAVAAAIDAGWEVGFGHGALHPRDVFVRTDGSVAITGFGIAQALESAGARAAVRLPYAAPERVHGGDWDRRADVYALAAIARELVNRAGAPSVAVAAVLDRALAEDPGTRYPSAQEFIVALESAVDASEGDVASPAGATAQVHRRVVLDEPAPADRSVADAPLVALRPVDDWPDLAHAPAALLPPVSETATPVDAPRFPWVAIAAVALAGLAAGGLLGYRAGFASATDARIEREVATAAAQSAGPVETAGSGVRAARPGNAADASSTVASPTPGSPSMPEEPRSVRPAEAPAGGRAVRPVGLGSITVDSRPRGAGVTVDGRAIGQTPLRVASMSPGDHRVLIELQGHRRVASTVRVVAGEQTRLAVSLEQTELAAPTRTGRKRD